MIGKMLGGYRIDEQIGKGGMGTVYKAYDLQLRRYVALKTLPPDALTNDVSRERFRREAQAIARLEHSRILPVYGYGEQDGTAYLVMRYLPTGTLADILERRGALPFAEAARLTEQIASALDYAHRSGVVHRDVKPTNILIDQNHDSYLSDFGIAYLEDVPSHLTTTGTAVGTPLYMSPEQRIGVKPLPPESDQYALAVMIYEMVTGQKPLINGEPISYRQLTSSDAIPSPCENCPDLPAAAGTVVLKGMAREPRDRYPSCSALAQAFAETVQSAGIGAAKSVSSAPGTGSVPGRIDTTTPTYMPLPDTPTERTPTPSSAVRTKPVSGALARGRLGGWLWLAAAGLLVILVISGIVLLSSPPGSSTPTSVAAAGASTTPNRASSSTPENNPGGVLPPTKTATPGRLPSRTPTATLTATRAPSSTTTPTPTPTATNTPTATPTPSATSTPTATFTASFTPTPATPVMEARQAIVARAGPGENYPEIETLNALDQFDIVEISPDHLWAKVILPNGAEGWVRLSSSLNRVYGDIAVAPTSTTTFTPTPTDTPTATPTSTATHTPTDTPTPTPTDTATQTPSATFTTTPTPTDTPTPTPTETASSTLTWTPTASPTQASTPTPTATIFVPLGFSGSNPVQRNADWQPRIQNFNGVDMVLVPAGCFLMGGTNTADEAPVKQRCFDAPFWIDRTEVTNAEYGSWHTFTGPQQPRDGVTWFEARDFCQRRGGRLPNESEWEYAARGPDDLIYPWGNDFVAKNVVFDATGDTTGKQTANVGSKPAGVSWVGALDMAGNVWEWTSSLYRPYPYDPNDGREDPNDTTSSRVLRGGSWRNTGTNTRANNRSDHLPTFQVGDATDVIGFRCAQDYNSRTGGAAPAVTQQPTPAPLPTDTPSLPTPTPIPLGFAGNPVQHNADWQPQTQTFAGIDMVLVPAGCFLMGGTNTADEQPLKQQCVNAPFWIDRTEITNAQYGSSGTFTGDQRPRDGVTWFEARDFCQKRGERLPTEAEWEYAARGPDDLIYPWGNDLGGTDYVVFNPTNQTTESADVGSKPKGVSWVGAVDMAGNLWEWTSSMYRPYPYDPNDGREDQYNLTSTRVLRGGSWKSTGYNVRANNRNEADPVFTDNEPTNTVGFRCARNFSPPVTGAQTVCTGSLPSRLIVGAPARVTPGGSANNVRSEVESGAIVGKIPPGEIFDVLEGPVCGATNGKTWWRVTYNGITGWTAESDTTEYWLEPVSAAPPTNTPVPAQTPLPTVTPIPLGFPGSPVTRNADWKRQVQTFSGIDMALVPAGCFIMGSNNGRDNELPAHPQCFDAPFWIGLTEVTNAQYGSPGFWSGDDLPRENVSWAEAKQFCEARGLRLPTEAEWEYAARGPDDLIYPWGNDFVADWVVYGGNSGQKTAPVGSHPQGASWVGALDMSGNVWEWTSTLRSIYPYDASDGREDTSNPQAERVVRGGSWLQGKDAMRSAYRSNQPNGSGHNSLGFRCARSFDGAVVNSANGAITPVAVVKGGVNLRSGPSTQYAVAGSSRRGLELPVLGQVNTPEGIWYLVLDFDGKRKWVSAGFVDISPPDAQIPEVQSTPAP